MTGEAQIRARIQNKELENHELDFSPNEGTGHVCYVGFQNRCGPATRTGPEWSFFFHGRIYSGCPLAIRVFHVAGVVDR